MNDAEALGRVFRELRGKMSQELVGYELGFTQRKVSDLERKGIYQVADLMTISEYYGVTRLFTCEKPARRLRDTVYCRLHFAQPPHIAADAILAYA